MGIIKFASGEGSRGVEKNFEEHLVDSKGDVVDARLPSGAIGFLMQFRNSDTATFRYSFIPDQVTDGTDGIFWSSKAGMSDGETGINIDAGATDKLNVYVSSSAASQTLEVRIWFGFAG